MEGASYPFRLKRGIGAALLPPSLVERDLQTGRLVSLLVEDIPSFPARESTYIYQ
jgi:DNA-binding transcriptional LysR family regulator